MIIIIIIIIIIAIIICYTNFIYYCSDHEPFSKVQPYITWHFWTLRDRTISPRIGYVCHPVRKNKTLIEELQTKSAEKNY